MPTCPLCRHENPTDAVTCVHCSRYRFPASDDPNSLTVLNGHKKAVPRFGELGDEPLGTQRALDLEPFSSMPPPLPRLVVVRGDKAGQEFIIVDGANHIGRSGDQPADIDLTGIEATEQVWSSRRHAVIHLDGPLLSLEDANSLNGTFLNRHKLQAGRRYHLKPGDVIQIGTIQLRVVI